MYNRHGIRILKRHKPLPPRTKPDCKIKGEASEKRFARAFRQLFEHPDFYQRMRKATSQEDAGGTDFFMITTHDLEIPFDIKSSTNGMRRHAKQRKIYLHKRRIIPLLVKDTDSLENIRERAFTAAHVWLTNHQQPAQEELLKAA